MRPVFLERLAVTVPEAAAPAYEAAFAGVCESTALFADPAGDLWRVEGIRQPGSGEQKLVAALAVAATVTGVAARLERKLIPAGGWLARNRAAFPEQRIGTRFAIRPTHLPPGPSSGRITLWLDANLAFGSGEHGSTRGCLRALEQVARRRQPRRMFDLGTGSGVLALAAARLFRRPVLASDIEPFAVRVARENARRNSLHGLVRVCRADGWRHPAVRAGGPYELVTANILARPLCAMARDLARHLSPGGEAILSGLLATQSRAVLAAHRRLGFVLRSAVQEGEWTTLLLHRPGQRRGA
jgi:ribosomal protein L11 methyltransferase